MKSFKIRLFMSFYIFSLAISLQSSDNDGLQSPGRATAPPSFYTKDKPRDLDLASCVAAQQRRHSVVKVADDLREKSPPTPAAAATELNSFDEQGESFGPFSTTSNSTNSRRTQRRSVAERLAERKLSESLNASNLSVQSHTQGSRDRHRSVVILSPDPSHTSATTAVLSDADSPSAAATSRRFSAADEERTSFAFEREETVNQRGIPQLALPARSKGAAPRRKSVAARLAERQSSAANDEENVPTTPLTDDHKPQPQAVRRHSMQVNNFEDFTAFDASTDSAGGSAGHTQRTTSSTQTSPMTDSTDKEHVGKPYDQCAPHENPAISLKLFIEDHDEEHNHIPRLAQEAAVAGGAATAALVTKKAHEHYNERQTRFVGEAVAASGLAVGVLKGVVGCVTVAYTYYKVRKWLYQDYVKKKRLQETEEKIERMITQVSEDGKKAHLRDKQRIEELEKATVVLRDKQKELIAANQDHANAIDRLNEGTDYGKIWRNVQELLRVTREHAESLRDCEEDFMEIGKAIQDNADAINHNGEILDDVFHHSQDTTIATMYLLAIRKQALEETERRGRVSPEQTRALQHLLAETEELIAKLETIAQEAAPTITSIHQMAQLKHHQEKADFPVEQAASSMRQQHKPAKRVEVAPKKKWWQCGPCCSDDSVKTRDESHAEQLAAMQARIDAMEAARDPKREES